MVVGLVVGEVVPAVVADVVAVVVAVVVVVAAVVVVVGKNRITAGSESIVKLVALLPFKNCCSTSINSKL